MHVAIQMNIYKRGKKIKKTSHLENVATQPCSINIEANMAAREEAMSRAPSKRCRLSSSIDNLTSSNSHHLLCK